MPEPHTTPQGTPCARTWTPDWIAVVAAQEESLGRPICGARLMSGNPCTLISTHASGRCRFHGGFDLTGAPEGNRNAVLHNLYSRRLMPCGSHCPVWQSCPLGGGAKDQGAAIIKLDQADRPTCSYEQTEYNTAVTDALQHIATSRINAYARHIAHMLALAQVMVTRAGLALREAEFTKPLVITGEKYHMTTPKIAPALTAYEKLERAWRRLLIDFERNFGTSWSEQRDDAPYQARIQSDHDLAPDAQVNHYDTMNPEGSETHVGAGPRPATVHDEHANNREGERTREPNPHDQPNGSPGASPSHHTTDPTSAETSAEGAPQISLGHRPRSDDAHPESSPEGAKQSSDDAPSAALARAP